MPSTGLGQAAAFPVFNSVRHKKPRMPVRGFISLERGPAAVVSLHERGRREWQICGQDFAEPGRTSTARGRGIRQV